MHSFPRLAAVLPLVGLVLGALPQTADACSLSPCLGKGMEPGRAAPSELVVPNNLPGVALDPLRDHLMERAMDVDVSAFHLEGSDGHRIDLNEATLQPPANAVPGRPPEIYASLEESLRPDVAYELVQPRTSSRCDAPLPRLGFVAATSSASLPTSAPRLEARPFDGTVYLYGSSTCSTAHQLPAVMLEMDLPSPWTAWTPAIREIVYVDGEPYSNWSIETETNAFTRSMDDRIIFARCGAWGSGGGIAEGPHEAYVVLAIPGHGEFATNAVEFILHCADRPRDGGVPDASHVDIGSTPDGGAARARFGPETAAGSVAAPEVIPRTRPGFSCRSWPSRSSGGNGPAPDSVPSAERLRGRSRPCRRFRTAAETHRARSAVRPA